MPSTTPPPMRVGRILVLAVGDLPSPILIGDVAAQHPAVREPLVEGERGAFELLLAIAIRQVEAVAGGQARTQLPVVDGVGVAVRRHDGDRGGLDVIARPCRPADRTEVLRRVGIAGIEDEPVGVEDVVRLAIGEVQADHEVGQQGVLDAEQQFIGDRRVEAGVDRRGLQRLQREGVDVGARRRDFRTEVAGVQRGTAVVGGQEIAVGGGAERVEEARGGDAELIGETRVAGAEQGLVLGAEGIGQAQAGSERAPGETGVLAGVVGGGQEIRKHRVGRRRGGEVLAGLAVIAQADVGREVALGERVLEEGAAVLGLDLGVRLADEHQQVGLGVEGEVDAPGLPVEERRLLRGAIAGAILQLVGGVAEVEEVRGVELALLLRPFELVEEIAVVPDQIRIEEGERRAPLGSELEAAVDDRIHAGEVEVVADDLGVLGLVTGRRGAEIGLVPGGLLGTQRAGVAAGLDLVAVEGEQGRGVGRRDLGVELAVPLLEGRLVAEVVDGEQIDFLPGVGAPEPELVLDDRTAELGAGLLVLVDPVPLLEGGLGVLLFQGPAWPRSDWLRLRFP